MIQPWNQKSKTRLRRSQNSNSSSRAPQRKKFSQHRHAFRGTHVKTQGVVKGKFAVLPDLPPQLCHALASPENASKEHDLAIRFANEPCFLQDDKAAGPRGMGMKVFDVDGDFLDPAGSDSKTQDLLFNNAPILELGDVNRCLEIFRIRERKFLTPEKIKEEISQRADKDLQMAPAKLPNHHFLAHIMYSQSAYRWGPYVAKYALFPADSQLKLAESHKITDDSDIDQHAIWLQAHFSTQPAAYTFCVQLCEDIDAQSVEDTTREWDQNRFPFRPIARVTIPAGQDSFDARRRVFWEEKMKLNAWYGLRELQPLGSVNRLRKGVYTASRECREKMNVTQTESVSSVDQIP